MNIGYACLTVGVYGTKQRTCMMKNATPDVLISLIQSNLESLDKILDYNKQNHIKLFRISSDIIPFGSHPVNRVKWWEIFSENLNAIGRKAKTHGIRLSMHPGQYTVLNSPNEEVVERAVEDLRYHARFLDAIGLGKEHKIILHIGGIYGDKNEAIKRFVQNYRRLDENIRRRLVIENDDRQYSISDVLSIGKSEGIPVVFDNLHHQVNPDVTCSETEWITACAATWKQSDGPQKLHYSQQNEGKRSGSHSATLAVDSFLQFYKSISQQELDIMVEVKDKNLSALKCINTIASPQILHLEKEWERYKYLVMEHSPAVYKELNQLMKDKNSYPVLEFYRLIEEASLTPVVPENAVRAARHVWGYFKDSADKSARLKFEKGIDKVSMGESPLPMKRLLWKLVQEQQDQQHLLCSHYFMEFLQ